MGVSPDIVSPTLAARANCGGTSLQESRALGVSFLLAHATRTGWSDFLTPVGESDQWVSGYVAAALAQCDDASEQLVAVGRHLSARQRARGGWGYNRKAPADADSTAAVLGAFAGTGLMAENRLRRAASFLARHADGKQNGIRTFRRTVGLRLLMRAFRCSFDAWCSPHVCVTGAAVEALARAGNTASQLRRHIEFLRAAQRDDGLWDAYWWRGPYYATAAATRAFRSAGESLPNPSAIEASLIRRQDPEGSWDFDANGSGSAFCTACAVSSLSQLSSQTARAAVEAGLNWLIRHQDSDGGWTSVPIMRIPHPYDATPKLYTNWREDGLGTGVLIRDQHRIFTTATVIRAMPDSPAETIAARSGR